jgi:heptosyltransferase-2
VKKFNKRKLYLFKFLYPFIYFFLKPFVSKKKYLNEEYKNILIVDLHLIGDIIILLPFIRDVLNSHKNANVTLVCGKWANSIIKNADFDIKKINIYNLDAPWIKRNSLTNWLDYFRLLKKLRKIKWDIGFDMRGDLRNSLFLNLVNAEKRVSYNLMYNGFLLSDVLKQDKNLIHLIDYHKNISRIYNKSYLENEFVPKLKNEKKQSTETIAIHLGASMKLRRPSLKKIYSFLETVVSKCGSTNNYVIFKLSEDEITSDFVYNFFTQQKIDAEYWEGNLDNFIEKLSSCTHIFCLDSGPAHIAAALGLEVNVIFGPSAPHYSRPIGKNVYLHGLKNKPSCWPCEGIKCVNNNFQICYSQNLLN